MAPGRIILEEAFNLPAWAEMSAYQARLFTRDGDAEAHANRLCDIQKIRIEKMDAHNVEYCILSLTAPGIQDFIDPKEAAAKAKEANDWVAKEVKQNPKRFGAFAALSMHDPKEAAAELTRCVKEYGFCGSLVNDNQRAGPTGDDIIFYDSPEWDVFWKACTDLDVPFYLHPIGAKGYIYEKLWKDRRCLIGPVLSFKHGVATHLMGMIVNGVFDRHPKLRVIIGHLGEGLIIDLSRASHWLEDIHRPRGSHVMKRQLRDYFADNITITTSGHFDTNALNFCINELGVDRVLFSVDYPYETFEDACHWWDKVEKVLPAKDYEAISRTNAIKICGLKGL